MESATTERKNLEIRIPEPQFINVNKAHCQEYDLISAAEWIQSTLMYAVRMRTDVTSIAET
jgi:hypothetical protein